MQRRGGIARTRCANRAPGDGLALAYRRCMSATTAVLAQTNRESERRLRSINVTTPTAGMLWFGGWLFTIGVAHLGFWKGVLGLIIWPYFLGVLAS
jgi:hypothetical protein